jgi:ubiquinone/menaquinone biosynthesis C-methylase UbiE
MNAFAGTAEDYARYRPPYPAALLERLRSLAPGKAQLLDLASGPGRIALAIAAWFDDVLAVDIEPDMLATGRRLADQGGITNITWREARAEDLDLPASSFDLITIGEAFHRLDEARVLDSAHRWLKPGGILATMGGTNVLRGSEAWQLKVFDVAERWTRDAFPRGWASALPGSTSDPTLLRTMFERHGFVDIADYQFVCEYEWTIDHVLGYLRSMSICSPAILGTRRADFEAAVRSALTDLNPEGVFTDALEFGLTVMRRRELGPAGRAER